MLLILGAETKLLSIDDTTSCSLCGHCLLRSRLNTFHVHHYRTAPPSHCGCILDSFGSYGADEAPLRLGVLLWSSDRTSHTPRSCRRQLRRPLKFEGTKETYATRYKDSEFALRGVQQTHNPLSHFAHPIYCPSPCTPTLLPPSPLLSSLPAQPRGPSLWSTSALTPFGLL